MSKKKKKHAQLHSGVLATEPISRRAFLSGAALGAAFLGVSGIFGKSTPARAVAPGSPERHSASRLRGAASSRQAILAAQPAPVFPESWTKRHFGLSEVSLGPGVYDRAYQEQLSMAREYDPDRMLAAFRVTAGIDDKNARPPGGWEAFPRNFVSGQDWGPAEYEDVVAGGGAVGSADGLLRGHYAGHYLSMLAMAYACSGEQVIKEKLDYVVDGLRECQEALAKMTYKGQPRYSHPGFLSAYGEWQFSALERYARYGEIWAPYYTLHKIVDGLINAYKFTGNRQALSVAENIGRWVYQRLSRCTAEQLERMWGLYIAGEAGGMNDVMVELYWLSSATDRQKFLDAAQFFDYNEILDACSSGNDILNGKHANQYIPTFVGYAKLYAATGEPRYLKAVEGFFDMVVPGRTYPHGGVGKGEMFGPPGATTTNLSDRNAESCAAYNMVKVAWQLFLITGDQKYTEYCERTVLNHLLGGRRDFHDTDKPHNVYMFPVNPAARKEWQGGQLGTCCGGTALEIPVRFQETVYARSKAGDTLYVNQYISTTLSWEEKGLRLKQTTDYPREKTVTLVMEKAPNGPFTVELRIPKWVDGQVTLTVNGDNAGVALQANSYASISREWKDGDVIELTLPLRLRLEKALDSDVLVTLFYGPAAYSLLGNESKYPLISVAGNKDLTGSFEKAFKWESERVGQGVRVSLSGRTFDPLYAGQDTTYHVYVEEDLKNIVFAGRNSGVQNPSRPGGKTLLEEIWDAAPFESRAEFLEAVRAVTNSYVSEGLLTSRNRQRILLAAAQSRIEGK